MQMTAYTKEFEDWWIRNGGGTEQEKAKAWKAWRDGREKLLEELRHTQHRPTTSPRPGR
jgi:hypothetical protein